MKRETTPIKITDTIKELCKSLGSEKRLAYIPVEVQSWSRLNECFLNVQQMVQEHGGRQINGWAIWQWANILVEAEAHSVWQTSDGNIIDITPHDNGESQILFLRDDSVVYSGQSIKSVRMAITNSPLAIELIDLSEKVEDIMCSYGPGTEIALDELKRQLLPLKNRRKSIISQLNQKAGRNDTCPCQSGLKYKKCCGR